MTLPLIECIKNTSEIEILDYLATPDVYNILELNPNISDVILYDKRGKDKGPVNLLKVIKKIRRGKYDIAYVPHRSLRSAVIPFFGGIKKRIGFNNSAAAFLFTTKVEYNKNIHEIERNLSLLLDKATICTEKRPKIYYNDDDVETIDKFFYNNKIATDEKLVGIAPGSLWATKRWLKESFAGLIIYLKEKKGVKTLIFGGKSDLQLCEEVNYLSKSVGINAAGVFTPRQSAVAMGRTNVVVTNDSGATHLAVGGNARVITIYGATAPEFGFYPYGTEHKIIEKELECRPCKIHGGDKCPEGHFKCMKDITPEEVFEEVCRFI